MGYNTDFQGQLTFTHIPTAPELAELNRMFGEDCRDHPEWDVYGGMGLSYIDLRLTRDFAGIEWDNETEKTYDLPDKVNVVIRRMRATWPGFGLTGQLAAQGEDLTDRWALVIGDDGLARRVDIVLTGQVVACPDCGHTFVLEGAA